MLKPNSSLLDQLDSRKIVKVAKKLIAFRTESEDGTDFGKAANYLLRILEGLGFETQTLGSDERPILVGI